MSKCKTCKTFIVSDGPAYCADCGSAREAQAEIIRDQSGWIAKLQADNVRLKAELKRTPRIKLGELEDEIQSQWPPKISSGCDVAKLLKFRELTLPYLILDAIKESEQ